MRRAEVFAHSAASFPTSPAAMFAITWRPSTFLAHFSTIVGFVDLRWSHETPWISIWQEFTERKKLRWTIQLLTSKIKQNKFFPIIWYGMFSVDVVAEKSSRKLININSCFRSWSVSALQRSGRFRSICSSWGSHLCVSSLWGFQE